MVDFIKYDEQYKFYELSVSKILNEDFTHLCNDALRMILLQITIQFMFFTKNPEDNPFFTYIFMETLIYLIIGLCIYWLILKKIIKIT